MSHSVAVDVVVVGGGIVGLCSAHQLARAGLSVAVLEAGPGLGQATAAATGVLPRPTRTDSDFAQLCWAGWLAWPRLLAQLGRADAWSDWAVGGVHLPALGETADQLRRQWQTETARGVPAELWSGDELRQRLPELSADSSAAIFYPEFRRLSSVEVGEWLLSAEPMTTGQVCRYVNTSVRAVRRDGAGLRVETDSADWRCGHVLLATGAWAGVGLPEVGAVPVVPIRGQAARLRPRRSLALPHIVTDGSVSVVPQPSGEVVVGATSESVGFDIAVTPALEAVLAAAERRILALAGAERVCCWAGLRPQSRQRLPIIGPLPDWPNVLVAAGHYKSGLLLGPITAELVTAAALGQPSPPNAERYRPRPSATETLTPNGR